MWAINREQVARLAGTRMLRLLPGLVGLIVALAFAPALAQPHYVRLTGWVQWIAGEKLMLVLDNGSGVVPVDLARVPLDEYRTLTQRDQVMVTGVVSEDNRGVFGASITRIPDWGFWEPQAP
jgi:hypothetical protein